MKTIEETLAEIERRRQVHSARTDELKRMLWCRERGEGTTPANMIRADLQMELGRYNEADSLVRWILEDMG